MRDELLSATAAARYLEISRQRIYELALAGRLGQRLAGYWVFTRSELDTYRATRASNTGGRPKQSAPPRGASAADSMEISSYLAAVLSYAMVQPYPGGGFVAEALDFPGVAAYGPTRDVCARGLRAKLAQLILDRLQAGDRLPEVNGITLHRSSD